MRLISLFTVLYLATTTLVPFRSKCSDFKISKSLEVNSSDFDLSLSASNASRLKKKTLSDFKTRYDSLTFSIILDGEGKLIGCKPTLLASSSKYLFPTYRLSTLEPGVLVGTKQLVFLELKLNSLTSLGT